MAELQIKNESLPVRCEICHKSDKFDAINNSCSRCAAVKEIGDILIPATAIGLLQFHINNRSKDRIFTIVLSIISIFIIMGSTFGIIIFHEFFAGVIGGAILGVVLGLIVGAIFVLSIITCWLVSLFQIMESSQREIVRKSRDREQKREDIIWMFVGGTSLATIGLFAGSIAGTLFLFIFGLLLGAMIKILTDKKQVV
jgi:hypothetical protein